MTTPTTQPPAYVPSYWRALSRLFGFMYWSKHRIIFSAPVSRWIHIFPLFMLFISLFRGTARAQFPYWIALYVFIIFAYWFVSKLGYSRFIPHQRLPKSPDTPLPDGQRITLKATGTFAVTGRSDYLLEHFESFYWRVPLGEHIVMIRQGPRQHLYQFFRQESLISTQIGYLLSNGEAAPAVAVRFMSNWDGKESQIDLSFNGSGVLSSNKPKPHVIYFTFTTTQDQILVWDKIRRDTPNNKR
ncbi:MAG TPA: hypothetical protein VLL52_17760 [Anaerolineae bacterium]|nr:hypothetical protein [Anaerolineae bacterium]